jgi:hypothetical protein
LVIIILVIALFYVLTFPGLFDNTSAVKSHTRTQELNKAMSYLSEIPEIVWYQVERNNVYIGFSPLPEDWEMIIKGAALRGNQAINFGCHVWAVDANKKGWRPGDSPFYGEVTARYGKLQ